MCFGAFLCVLEKIGAISDQIAYSKRLNAWFSKNSGGTNGLGKFLNEYVSVIHWKPCHISVCDVLSK